MNFLHYLKLFSFLFIPVGSLESSDFLSFPDDFMFGTATSAYQIEGAWDADGKTESIWDHLTHSDPDLVIDSTNGDIACDSYNQIDEDVALLKYLGVQYYRFSISWTRILPEGFSNKVNPYGISYYSYLIDSLLENGIEPMVTLYHWDLPQVLQKLGGWANVKIVDYFTDYSRVAFENFGHKVKYWITFNEPEVFCQAYGAHDFAPMEVKADGIGDYLCSHHVILAHASAYHLYNDTYRPLQNGSVGIGLRSDWYVPKTSSKNDADAAERMLQFTIGRFGHPIFLGDYPDVVKQVISNRSTEEGFPYSRLPKFSTEEIHFVRGSSDFLGLNFYTAALASEGIQLNSSEPSFERDHNVIMEQDNSWQSTELSWLMVTPWSLRELLLWLKEEYNSPAIFITENGVPDPENYQDDLRISYLKGHLKHLLLAINDGVNVKSYTYWSLLDNFEWLSGYTVKFGINHVNMSDPSRSRSVKASAYVYKEIISNRRLYIDEESAEDSESSVSKLNFNFSCIVTLFMLMLLY